MEKYQYTPLPPDRSEIRLVRLQPGLPGSDVQIEILHAQLSTNPDYEALSYAWGYPDPTETIYVRKASHKLGRLFNPSKPQKTRKRHKRSSTLGIAENLFAALQHLRCPAEPRTLWIDAICINQGDMDERSSEVVEMGSIYNNAREVIVWLGPSSPNSDLALQTLKLIGEGNTYDPDEMTNKTKPGSWPNTLGNNTEVLISHKESWFAVKDILTREWFSRLWVFQEIVLARKATLVVGEKSLDWKITTSGLEWIWMKSAVLDELIEYLDFGNLLTNPVGPIIRRGCKATANGLSHTLNHTRKLVCSDPRDRLYAIRSLLYPERSRIIVPDYFSTVEEVYTNFAKEWLSKLGDAELFAYCEISQTSQDIDLPSWVPDWRRTNTTNFNGRCSGDSRAFPTVGSPGSSLSIEGVVVGSLSYASPLVMSFRTGTEIQEICRSWMQLSMSEGIRGHFSFGYFAEMIVGGQMAEKNPVREKIWPGLDEVRTFLTDLNNLDDPSYLDPEAAGKILYEIRRAIGGRSFFKTGEGHIGVGPPSARLGDRVAVILGCYLPLILRLDELSEEKRFRIVGSCYVPGIMDAEALLGPLPSGWSARQENVQDGQSVMMFANGDCRTQKDPRLPPLPSPWRYIYGDEEAAQEEAENLEDMMKQWFENVETGDRTDFDPRLTPEFLRERGVAVEELILV
ncbi:uncharacterized protein PAC_16734 [Phialocephala subalpina]|uniref:Heterokaryon incompatibility domain-containing protein n=1 Tax=Phialocephala subalpina TaxID=576137 RepID=A0A1L7XP76_9HELO|nr:uncharacterized protein PAC_16734 [Phialocephala subalpina]